MASFDEDRVCLKNFGPDIEVTRRVIFWSRLIEGSHVASTDDLSARMFDAENSCSNNVARS